jgi:hypothetical protein
MSLKAIPPKVMFLLFSITLMVASCTHGAIAIEDFNSYASKPPTTEFDNGTFHHSIAEVDPGYPATKNWDISTSNPSGPPLADNALILQHTQDIVTFNLTPGQYIDFASVKVINWGSLGNLSIIIFRDVNGASHQEYITALNQWSTYDTSTLGLGNLQSITLFSYDGAFDDLQVNVVPEPISILLIGAGSLMARRRKRI